MRIHPDRTYPLHVISGLASQIVDLLQRRHTIATDLTPEEEVMLRKKLNALKGHLPEGTATIDALIASLTPAS